jgi:3-deoxy-D-manno-octulosonic-acid transferase
MNMLDLYRLATGHIEPALQLVLNRRLKNGKEAPGRVDERKGIAPLQRLPGTLVHLHAASVGEAQSALVIIDRLLKADDKLHVLITTGTVTSARMMEKNLPARSLHQFAPLDHPGWVKRFMDHWRPDLVLWMESELWPNMLHEIKSRGIPSVLINARLSDKSFSRWKYFKNSAHEILSSFNIILAQTEKDTERFGVLGACNVITTDNLKFSAKPLGYDEGSFKKLSAHLGGRPLWLFASTHKGEETMAARVHERLKASITDLLTIIVPRHPDRRDQIEMELEKTGLKVLFRGEDKTAPTAETDIYIADTMGELGLFYRLAPVACIGRSFSDDGGGGHNPIEAAQLHCAVLHGPHIQYQKAIYDEMNDARAAVMVEDESALVQKLNDLLIRPDYLESCRKAATDFLRQKESVVDRVMNNVLPLLEHAK